MFGRLDNAYPSGSLEAFESLKLGSEKNLELIQHEIFEAPVASIIRHLHSLDGLDLEYNLGNGIMFENHLNTLSDAAEGPSQSLES